MNIRQGEVRFIPVDDLGSHETRPIVATNGVIIVGESESHHHHVLDADGVTVMERINVPAGMRILEAIVEKPTRLRQTAGNPHGSHEIAPGKYEIRIKREFNPFMEMARRVAD
ncbi:hypothetical protein CDV50_03330 [Haematobacter massiliensis]|uniref:Uncharacterized protein n=1 Tax=Haematobacter massiliensis TaxID=195105 RepID=A0A086XX99_9RHOB|nr:hypothetical protein [Haematobacter massiliensis]KFI26649.1 hypothetical protein CN97_02780 [Haematobacter massiliensis]OWJ73326.1 hypothetical protein CDV50_03330 [Haematobacter massiliensis]OWJ86320.1 hypothetical protein CDV51_10315 [Haematobacter massiliensis]